MPVFYKQKYILCTKFLQWLDVWLNFEIFLLLDNDCDFMNLYI